MRKLRRILRRVTSEVSRHLDLRRRADGVDVSGSARRGHGLFALRAYEPGELILAISGSIARERGEYTIQVGRDAHIEPDSPLRYANHSCDPNSGIRISAEGAPALHAMRAIRAGEEITWDYAMAEADFVIRGVAASFPCRCGAEHCRGVVAGGWSGLPAERRRSYADWVMPHLR
ncbi:MAG: SET domain-containing protein-lysine N-methyltransferase [Candidatus Binatia bacterium]